MKFSVIVNPNAGRQQREDSMEAVKEILAGSGARVELIETHSAREGREAVGAAVKDAADCLVCCGGDGTLSDTINWMLDANGSLPLGYIPAGTTNDFAASLGLSKDPAEAARQILSSPARPLDLGFLGERSFIYTASFGAFAEASYSADPNLKHALGHLAYVIEGVKELPTIRPHRVRVETAEGQVFEDEFIFGSVTNSLSLGGVLRLDPAQVDLADGRFELLLVRNPRTLNDFNRMIFSLVSGRYDEGEILFTHTAGARFTFDEPMDWSLDGEYASGTEQAEFRAAYRALKLHY